MFPSQMDGFDLDAEAVLDPEIQPLPEVVNLGAKAQKVFLTGATGFVGAYLLRELLDSTEAAIYCLVRAESIAQGHERIKRNLSSYDLWLPEAANRIIPVPGDLKLPRFGLTSEQFAELAREIDVIYHCGSKLSYVAPYEYLKDANVGGTVEALRLATQSKAKPVHYVSSLGILMAYKALVGGQEADELDATKCPDVGYFRSKYVGERVIRLARDRGIPVTIHRIGLIVGDSRSGVSNTDDFVARILIGSIQAGYAPDIRNAMDMTPVNYVAASMVYLSRRQESTGRVFHLLNPNPVHWADLFGFVNDTGYSVEMLPFHQWVEAIENHADPDNNPLYPLMPFFHIQFARRMLGIDDSHFRALGTQATQSALDGSGYNCPVVDREMVNTFLDKFVETGRLHPASVMLIPEEA